MITLFQTAAGITSMWGLAAVAVLALLYFSHRRRGRTGPITWGVVVAIVLLVLVTGWLQLQREGIHQKDIYHLRVTVLDPQNTPVNDARVWSSTDAIPKKVDGGWEFSIPSGSKPSNGR
jgi:thiol:disulfide interchange protein